MSWEQDIIRMSNDVARFWKSYPRDEACDSWSEHINKFWEPTMRSKLIEMVKTDPEPFDALVISCVDKIKCAKYNPIRVEFKDKSGSGG